MNSIRQTIQSTRNYTNVVYILRFSSTASHKQNVIAEETLKSRLLKVAIIGMPNAGKSTLINSLMDRKVCPVSSKVHTTKKKSLAIFTEDDAQIVFLDTPGIVTSHERKKFKLNRSFMTDGTSSLQRADLIGVVHDASNTFTSGRIDVKILNLLEEFKKKPSFLVLNKVDLIKQKRSLLELTRKLTENRLHGRLSMKNIDVDDDEVDIVRGWPFFNEVFMLSALTGNGSDQLRNYLLDRAKPAPWMFPPEKFTDDDYEDIIVHTVRAKFLDFLPQEIPYNLEPKMELFETDETGKITTTIVVKCPSQRIARLVGGRSDGRLREIMIHCQEDLQNTFRNYVRLNIVLNAREEVKKNKN